VKFRSFALPEFWKCCQSLPANVQALADAKFALFEKNPFHPSLALKHSYRVIAYSEGDIFHWFWIGTHAAYNNLLSRFR